MKFLKSTLALAATVALLTSPAAAQYGKEEEAAAAAARAAVQEGGGLKGIFQIMKALVLGGAPPPIFEADPEGHIFNVTDVNYKETIFEDEWIITL